ncbi:hypothetical protein EWM64_g4697 [Hericium alpestre]|uniref:Cytochrome P450 n=1 Tax=Hericium alpestre TaxID=135208 RepID=A0A4Y9ZZB3_9AGAM|nr:hypothetical protein EWM64_g4697 [Hericium alpestre]
MLTILCYAGPNELSFGHASAIPDILGRAGATSGLPKGPYWAHRDYPANLIAERTLARHAVLRKEWSRGFTTLALKDYEPMVMGRVRQLLESLQERCSLGEKGTVLDMASWASYFATDFMGDIMFGGGFELMEHGGDKHGLWDLLESGLDGEDQTGRAARPAAEVANDGILAIIAGSDTTATILSALVFHLLSNPTAYERLQAEVDAAFPQGEEPHDTAKMAGMEYLNACLNEALRLTPAIPNGSPRGVPQGEGPQIISGHVVPEGTQVFVHTWTVHRDPRNFPHPTSYIPERWLSAENNTAAFIPFSHGPSNCVGKNLALMEMRMVVCALLQRFELLPAEGFERWEDSLEDYFVFKKSPLPVRFIPRG